MPFLLDTCAVCEYSQKEPNKRVLAVLDGLDSTQTFVSAITLAEIRKGIELQLPDSRRRVKLDTWFREKFIPQYDGRIIAFDEPVAARWGAMTASLIPVGLTMGYADSQIAATALVHDLTVVTRNTPDFIHSGVRILNPWK